MNPILTIAIPTYARNEILRKTVEALIPQLTGDCRLLILDNCSPEPVEGTLAPLSPLIAKGSCRIIRNRFNIGGDANILRCFELCETPWMWTLGDDDVLMQDAVASILSTISRNPHVSYISFLMAGLGKLRSAPVQARGVEGFAEMLDVASLVNFMSCSVWRVSDFQPVLRFAYGYTYSMGWAYALLIKGLGTDRSVLFSNIPIIQQATVVVFGNRWSHRKFILGWPTLLELIDQRQIQRTLAKKMLSTYSPENVTAYFLADAASGKWPSRLYYYRLVANRLIPYRVHYLARIRFSAYSVLFLSPSIGWRIVKFVISAANRAGLKHIDTADMEGRGE